MSAGSRRHGAVTFGSVATLSQAAVERITNSEKGKNMKLRNPMISAALLVACCLQAVACGSMATTSPDAGTTPITTTLGLRDAMRKLWVDHVLWTRVVVIDAAAGLPDLDAASGRLLQNQVDIGNAIKPFYGEAAGNALAALLHDHITIAVEVVGAAKAGDTAKFADAQTRWYANADQIASFLASANPNWPEADLKMMMKMHLDKTLADASARLGGDWAGEIVANDALVADILTMADALSDGIAKQFPALVSTATTTAKDNDLHLAMRALWEDHVTLTRAFLISAIAGLPDTSAAAGRLLQNQVDIGNAVKPYYGEAAGNALAALLHDHITIAAEVVTAAKAGDAAKFADAQTRWYANADQIAVFLAGANPNWPVADLKMMMKMHLDRTLAEASARLGSDWAADITTYDAIVADILSMADALSGGIAKQFPTQFVP